MPYSLDSYFRPFYEQIVRTYVYQTFPLTYTNGNNQLIIHENAINKCIQTVFPESTHFEHGSKFYTTHREQFINDILWRVLGL